jgi:hypothetical protein
MKSKNCLLSILWFYIHDTIKKCVWNWKKWNCRDLTSFFFFCVCFVLLSYLLCFCLLFYLFWFLFCLFLFHFGLYILFMVQNVYFLKGIYVL